jgi:medium-chain acyl-[acyl-carrier-protein] hydrolase
VTLSFSYDSISLVRIVSGGVFLNPSIFEKYYPIHYYEIDYNKKVLLTSLMNYLDDIAISQSEKLGVGVDSLKKHHRAWMLYKWDITIHKHPVYGDNIRVQTAPHSFYKFYAYRWFKILNDKDEVFVTANSLWLFINTDKRCPVKIPNDIYETYGVESNEHLKIDDIKKLSFIDVEREFHVRYSDIDTNKHVNNVKYAAWAIETIPLDIVLNYNLSNLKVTYKKETTYGKTIKSLVQILKDGDNLTCLHSIVDKNDKELCLLESRWIKKD